MDSMSDFVASAVEFIVGGILFTLASTFLLVTLASPDGWVTLSDGQMDFVAANATLLGIIFIAASYAAGVVGESLARSQVEWLLDRQTVRHPKFQDPPGQTKSACKAAQVYTPSMLGAAWKALKVRLTELALGKPFTVADLRRTRDERERQRTVVMTKHEQLHSEVQGQLKRLRLERVFTFSLGLTAIALAVRQDWLLCAVASLGTLWGVWLVNTRFGRYLNSIARGHDMVVKHDLKAPANDAS